jgi:hypothetical protein
MRIRYRVSLFRSLFHHRFHYHSDRRASPFIPSIGLTFGYLDWNIFLFMKPTLNHLHFGRSIWPNAKLSPSSMLIVCLDKSRIIQILLFSSSNCFLFLYSRTRLVMSNTVMVIPPDRSEDEFEVFSSTGYTLHKDTAIINKTHRSQHRCFNVTESNNSAAYRTFRQELHGITIESILFLVRYHEEVITDNIINDMIVNIKYHPSLCSIFIDGSIKIA